MIAPASCAYPFCVAARDTDIHVICGANQCIGKCLTEYGKQCHAFVELRTYESGEVTQSGAVPMSVSSTVAATDQAERESLPRADYLIARKNAEGLLPCPFCGWEEPQPQFDAAGPDEDASLNNGYVQCLECGAFGPTGSTPEEGIKLWNERITSSPADARHSSVARWLNGGQLHCDAHRQGIPYFFAAPDAVCAECSNDAPESYVKRQSRDEAKGAQGE